MITCEHFIYGIFDNSGYKLLRSPNLSKVLSDENLHTLRSLGNEATQETFFQVWFPKEQLLALSYVKPTDDEYGRKVAWNHTIILTHNNYLNLALNIFNNHFIREPQNIENPLQPITIK